MNTLNKILYLIKKNGLTEIEFTKLINLNKTAVSDWKSGKSKSYLKHIPKIANVLNVSEDYLLLENLIPSLTSDQQELLDLYSKLNKNQKYELIEHARILTKSK